MTVFTEDIDDEVFREYAQKLGLLIMAAECDGVVLTIDLEPQQPLAMGNYRMVGFVRGAR